MGLGQGIEATQVLKWTLESPKPVIVHEGGSRSSKTISIIQWVILYCQANRGKMVTIARKHLVWLRPTVYLDFLKVLNWYGFYRESNLRKGDMSYQLFGNTVRFIGLDESDQKIHGMEQDVTWINEGIEANKDQFDQLEQRTNERFIIDYNPKFSEHWLYHLELRPDVALFRSTMLNNPYIPERQRAKILSYEPTPENIKRGTADPNKWNIYGLGKRGNVEGLIFSNVNSCESLPEEYNWRGFGLDFGFSNDPSALIECRYAEGQIWMKEHLYSTGLNTSELSQKFEELGLSRRDVIIADSASPMTIDELGKVYGWRVYPAVKGSGSVKSGLDQMKSYSLNITLDSVNLQREMNNYRFKYDKNKDTYLNDPAPAQDDHGIDAARYCITYHLKPSGKSRVGGVY